MLKEILKILENDSRTPAKQIATMTGTSAEEVTKLVKEAEANHTILKYKTIVNWNKLDEEEVSALIEVRIAPQREVGFDAIAERIYRFPQARSVYLLSGTYDLLVVVTGKTMHEVAEFVTTKLENGQVKVGDAVDDGEVEVAGVAAEMFIRSVQGICAPGAAEGVEVHRYVSQ